MSQRDFRGPKRIVGLRGISRAADATQKGGTGVPGVPARAQDAHCARAAPRAAGPPSCACAQLPRASRGAAAFARCVLTPRAAANDRPRSPCVMTSHRGGI